MNDSKTSNDSGKSKHKKKVSFSIFEVSTFDELAKLRKMREEELDYFVINKKKTNQYLNNLNQRSKILSLSNNELLSLDNTNVNDNINSRNIKKNISIPKPIRKEGSVDDSNNNILNFDNRNKLNNIILNKKTLFSDEEEEMKTNEMFPSIPQFNSIEKNEIISDINILKPNNIMNNNKSVNNIEEELNNIKKIKNNIDEKNDKNNVEIIDKNNIQNKDDDNILIQENIKINYDSEKNIKENNIELEENNNNDNDNDNNRKRKQMNAISFCDVLEKIFNISPIYKLYYIKEFFNNINKFIDNKFDLYLDYESTDPSFVEEIKNKSKLIHHKIYYNYFINKIKNISKKNKIYKEHKQKAKKYKEYLNYKYKAYAFNYLYTFGKKQREWIKSIRFGFQKKMVWDCVDSLKLYANYKKIKNYLKIRKKQKIFDVLKNNKQLSIKLLKNGKKLNLIFEYRHFFNNCRKKILAKKGMEINDKLVYEFRNQNLMRNIFRLIQLNCEIKKAKKNRYENIIMKNKIKNDNYINIKITRKETVKFNNGTTLMRIQNKINVI